MLSEKAVFVGPRLRRLRRDLGLTQITMAEELGISPSYIALIERNQRPLTAAVLLKLASIYEVDLSQFVGDGGAELTQRVDEVLDDPLFSDLDLGPSEPEELAVSHPGLAEALIRAHRAYTEGQLALADYTAANRRQDPIEEVRAFIAARRNYFHDLDVMAERIGVRHPDAEDLAAYLNETHGYTARRVPHDVMVGAIRRLDPHRRELLLDRRLKPATYKFQLALQIAYLDLGASIDAIIEDASDLSSEGGVLARRALGNYAAGAIVMPYQRFHTEAVACRYDIEVLSHQFGASFEQIAHRLTSLGREGLSGVPFFLLRVDPAGNVSKRLGGSDIPFARHGGTCPLWSAHGAFKTPGVIVTQFFELPDGERFFSVSRTVLTGGGGFKAESAERVIALGCSVEHVGQLVYTDPSEVDGAATPVGVSCRLCQRSDCLSRAEPPLGRQVLRDDLRRGAAPFLFADEG